LFNTYTTNTYSDTNCNSYADTYTNCDSDTNAHTDPNTYTVGSIFGGVSKL
jgi:hypothetical protein